VTAMPPSLTSCAERTAPLAKRHQTFLQAAFRARSIAALTRDKAANRLGVFAG